jgi:NhaA family Na+:H+ antiporter
MTETKNSPIDKITKLILHFIEQEKSGSIVLGISVIIALFLANTTWAADYHSLLEYNLGFQWNNNMYFERSLHHWINEGLMAVFFFVVGLELKREIVGGELSHFRDALLPAAGALGGIAVPAAIYLLLNQSGEAQSGWGIPMATDIAFALGILYLLGDKIPLPLKIFLTALAIVDDLCAILVIAFFYTSDISMVYLLIAALILFIMYISNRLGVRNILFYAILGIGGLWTAFMLSGIHATLAAVLAAFAIPANVRLKEKSFATKTQQLLDLFKSTDSSSPVLSGRQLHILEEMHACTISAMPPLQRLERSLHPVVSFIIIPIFALANAGVSFNIDVQTLFSTNIALGVAMGLLLGKFAGIVGTVMILIRLKVAAFPEGMNIRNLIGVSLLSAIGFTMSLFITSLAFANEEHITQAKVGIFAASIIGGLSGYLVLHRSVKH